MPNRTISLSPIADLIRKKLVKEKNISFSSWITEQLMVYNQGERDLEGLSPATESLKKIVPWHYQCSLCRQNGHHHSNCSMYDPKIEGLPGESQ